MKDGCLLRVLKKSNSLITAVVMTMIMMAVFLCTGPALSGAGDLNIAEFLLSEGKIGSGFYYISPLLCDILRPLNQTGHVNWWSIYSVFVTFTSLFAILLYLLKLIRNVDWTQRGLVISLFGIFFWELILKSEINFGQTATCAAAGGVVLLTDAVGKGRQDGNGRIDKTTVFKLALGTMFLMFSALTRGGMITILLPFSFMIATYNAVFPIPVKDFVRSLLTSLKRNIRFFLPCVIIVIVMFANRAAERMYERAYPDYKEWKETNAAGGNICDYPEQYPEYSENIEIYEQAGLRASWLNMIYDFCYSDKNTFTPETLGIMKAFRTPSQLHISDLTEMLKEHMLLWAIVIAIILTMGFIYGRNSLFIPLSGAVAGFIVCSLYCIYRGRIAWRVTNGYTLFALLSVLIMVSAKGTVRKEENTESLINTRINCVVAICLVVLVAFAAIKDEKEHISKPVSGITNENQARLLEYIDENDDTLYLYFDLIRFGGAYNLWTGHAPDYLDNYIPLTTCFVRGCREELESRGITDLYRDLLTKPKIYVEYSSNTLNSFYSYLRDFYDPCTTATVAEDLVGNLYFRFSSQTVPQKEEHISTDSTVSRGDIHGNPDNVEDTYLIECRVPQEDMDVYKDFWINVEDKESGRLYSYGMSREDGKVLGTILRMRGTWNPDNCVVSLVGADTQGQKVWLDDVSSVFAEYNAGLSEQSE